MRNKAVVKNRELDEMDKVENEMMTDKESVSDYDSDDSIISATEDSNKNIARCRTLKSRVMNKERDEKMSEETRTRIERCKKFKAEIREKHDEKYNEKHDRDKQMDRDRLNKFKDFGKTTDKTELQKQLQELLLILVQLLQQQMAVNVTTS